MYDYGTLKPNDDIMHASIFSSFYIHYTALLVKTRDFNQSFENNHNNLLHYTTNYDMK